MKELAACLSGGFPCIPAHLGAMTSWIQSGLDPPGYICGSSSGGIIGSVAVQWDEEIMKEMCQLTINLKKRQFASLHPKIRNRGIGTILATSGMLVPIQKIKNPILHSIAKFGVIGLSLWMQKKFVTDTLFHSESFLVYDNLVKLLLNKLNFDKIFNSKIKLELLSVNINKAGWILDDILKNPPLYTDGWKNLGWVRRTNFRPEDINLPTNERNLRFLKAVVNGARIWSIFDAGRTDEGDFIVDTAAMSNVPVHAPINEGYDKIVLFYYNRLGEGPTDKVFESLLQITFRTNDIIVAENTRKTILGYFRINNDIEQMAKQRENLKQLGHLVYESDVDSTIKEKVRDSIKAQEESFRKLSYFNKKRIKFIIIRSEPLPPIHFASFSRDDMIDTINKGAKALKDSLPQLEDLYKTA